MPRKQKSAWSKDELKKIVDRMPSGWPATLASEHSLSAGTVKNIMYGAQANNEVVNSAIELVRVHKAQMDVQKEMVNAL